MLRKYILIGDKGFEYYKDLLIRADKGLHEQVALKAQELIPKTGMLLDFGCGQGALSLRLHDLGYTIISVDTNENDFKCKNIRFEKVNFNLNESVDAFLEKYSKCFDLVLGVESIEHVENPWSYIRIIKSLLKEGGHILITTPNITSWISRIIFLITGKFHQFSDNDLSYGHISPISIWEIENILKREGFVNIKSVAGGTLPPIWLLKNSKILKLSFCNLFLYPFMKGIKRGWCIVTTAQKGNCE